MASTANGWNGLTRFAFDDTVQFDYESIRPMILGERYPLFSREPLAAEILKDLGEINMETGNGRKIAVLRRENEELKSERIRLEKRIEKLQGELENAVHQTTLAKNGNNDEISDLRKQVCEYGERNEKLEELLAERNRQYQKDCIAIKQLNTTVETLSVRLAAHMRT